MIRCVNCGGLCDDNALACKYCGRSFADRYVRPVPTQTRRDAASYSQRSSYGERRSSSQRSRGRSARNDYSLWLLLIVLLTGNLLVNFISMVLLLAGLLY